MRISLLQIFNERVRFLILTLLNNVFFKKNESQIHPQPLATYEYVLKYC